MRIGLHVLCFVAFASAASAQEPFNPYRDPPFGEPQCHFNPYIMKWVCPAFPDASTGVTLAVAEGVLGAPSHELGWVVVLNPDGRPQFVQIELIVGGRPAPISRLIQAPAYGRVSYELHTDTELASAPIVTFGTIVRCQRGCAAQLVTRAAADPWRTQHVLTLAPLPQPTPTGAPQESTSHTSHAHPSSR
jgi:hypothetical protein